MHSEVVDHTPDRDAGAQVVKTRGAERPTVPSGVAVSILSTHRPENSTVCRT
jgi:hypothetical protein